MLVEVWLGLQDMNKMNKKEAKQVLKIISTADGGCPFCVTSLLDCFVLKFPEHKDITKCYYKKYSDEKNSYKLKGELK